MADGKCKKRNQSPPMFVSGGQRPCRSLVIADAKNDGIYVHDVKRVLRDVCDELEK